MEKLLERERELAAIEVLLRSGEVLVIEGRAGIGKTSLVDAASQRAAKLGYQILRARGSELEAEFAFGVVRQLFERRLAAADEGEREALLLGPAAAVRPLLLGQVLDTSANDSWFAVLHGLYWLAWGSPASTPARRRHRGRSPGSLASVSPDELGRRPADLGGVRVLAEAGAQLLQGGQLGQPLNLAAQVVGQGKPFLRGPHLQSPMDALGDVPDLNVTRHAVSLTACNMHVNAVSTPSV
ncbi:MAG TPA: AAA family ATPase [Anaeromyxobacteraceae bacterium]|nr:AAA family ATPase [Anaeromyxobacteraceae bacterium]